jgi:hypothetical protein
MKSNVGRKKEQQRGRKVLTNVSAIWILTMKNVSVHESCSSKNLNLNAVYSHKLNV